MANQEITEKKTETNLVLTDAYNQSMIEIIAKAASDPTIDVGKMERLLDMQERLMAKRAEMNFNNDLTALQEELPRIKKAGQIIIKGVLQSTFAKYEDIDTVIRPLLIKNGFSLRFNSRETNGKVTVTGTLAHRDGHSITDEIPLTIDTSGSKNNVQGVGSTIAYGKRYLVGMLLNLVFEGEDDDGQKGGFVPITEEQAREIKKLLKDSGADEAKFLAYVEADKAESIPASNYAKALTALKRRLQSKGGAQ